MKRRRKDEKKRREYHSKHLVKHLYYRCNEHVNSSIDLYSYRVCCLRSSMQMVSICEREREINVCHVTVILDLIDKQSKRQKERAGERVMVQVSKFRALCTQAAVALLVEVIKLLQVSGGGSN